MRRRLFYLMPDLPSARRMMDDLLLARVDERHIHVLARRGTSMQGLHEANLLQKSDLVHGAQIGFGIGAVLGVAVGVALVTTLIPDERWQIVTVLGACIVGALFGTWVSSMVGSSTPNSRLRQFSDAIDAGRILVMADVPDHRLNEVRDAMRGRHPEAEDRGIDPHIPAFP
ncbi:MAG TPA: DUF1269 domain-containing protein [Casimicrobiaceae bacterium]|jgi:hypothetical protein